MTEAYEKVLKIREMMMQGEALIEPHPPEDVDPADIVRTEDLFFGSGSEPARERRFRSLDLFRPAAAEGRKLPVIVSVHGGGWILGDKAGYRPYCNFLSREVFAVIAVNYHLAPEAQFPVPLEDLNLAFGWILAHADEYDLDTEHIFAVGDSAGAHLLALYTCFLTNGQYAGQFSFRPPEGLALTAVALNCGAIDIRPEDRDPKDTAYDIMDAYLPGGATDGNLLKVCVTEHVTKRFPPCFLMSGTGDFLLPHQYVMQAALAKKNLPFEFHFYSQGSVRLGHVFHLNINKEASVKCNRDECDFFKRFL